MSTATTIIGPEHDGQRMRLNEFDQCEVREGYLYELAAGVVSVIDVPKPRHGLIVNACRRQFEDDDAAQPGRIHALFGGSECKILIPTIETERHLDLAVYLTPCPDLDSDIWSNWIPELVIEVVSKSSSSRDYDEKRRDYLQAGIQEYWIVDAFRDQMTQLVRSGDAWTEQIRQPIEIAVSSLLPGFEFNLQRVFDAARQ